MIRRSNQIYAYAIQGTKALYFVTLETLKNTEAGAPRYKAVIIKTETNLKCQLVAIDGIDHYNAVFTFKGHYLNPLGEARWIVDYYENQRQIGE